MDAEKRSGHDLLLLAVATGVQGLQSDTMQESCWDQPKCHQIFFDLANQWPTGHLIWPTTVANQMLPESPPSSVLSSYSLALAVQKVGLHCILLSLSHEVP